MKLRPIIIGEKFGEPPFQQEVKEFLGSQRPKNGGRPRRRVLVSCGKCGVEREVNFTSLYGRKATTGCVSCARAMVHEVRQANEEKRNMETYRLIKSFIPYGSMWPACGESQLVGRWGIQ